MLGFFYESHNTVNNTQQPYRVINKLCNNKQIGELQYDKNNNRSNRRLSNGFR